MFSWFSKTIDAKDYLRQQKTVKINGVVFVVKKISIEDHLAGLNVILNIHQTYKTKPKEPTEKLDDLKQLRKFMRDIIYAGVVMPKLNMGKDQNENLHVDEILNDMVLAQKLTSEIINLAYGKKK